MVPRQIALGDAAAFAFDRVANERAGLGGIERSFAKDFSKCINIVTVYFANGETERGPLVRERLQSLDLRDCAVGLLFVVINQDGELRKFVLGRRQGRFPNAALAALAIAEDREHPMSFALELRVEREADAERQTMSETTR